MQIGPGKFLETYFENAGGINLSDSVFTVKDGQATGGYNYDYVKTGGFQKSLCPSRLNAAANAQLRTLGLFLRHTKAGSKTIVRTAGTKLQLTNLIGTFTNLTEDTQAAGSDFLSTGATQPVVGAMTTAAACDVLWMAGGGMGGLYGAVSDSKVTKNGVPEPTGSLSVMESGGAGAWATTGVYYYAAAFRKASTSALSNAALDVRVTITNVANTAVVDLSALSNLDTTKYDQIYIYRSAVAGVSGFTAGDLVGQVASTATSFTDTGTYISTAENIPRSGNVLLDNSELDSGTYNLVAMFKRHLVTAKESTLYFSDLDKFESWPLGNDIPVPSGGPITALGVISFTTPSAQSTDEYLAVFKENELWVVTGTSPDNFSLKWVDSTGCLGQPLVVSANGYLYFIDNRGVYLWDGAGKPIYLSRIIEDLFGTDGQLDRSKLNIGFGVFFKRQNQVVWSLSHTETGEQKYLLKLDLRQTLPQVGHTLGERIIDGCFVPGKLNNPAYAGASFIFPTSSNQEDVFITGDNAGYLYRQFYSTIGVGANDYDFTYESKYLDCGKPRVTKQFEKVYVWVENVGDWDLVLDYWTDFRRSDDDKHSTPVTINPDQDGTTALWDVAKWDQAKWDGFKAVPKLLQFNLTATPYNNNIGEVIRLRFKNQNSAQPVTIYGFGVVYSDLGLR